MRLIQVFEPAMCCSTGVCGPEVDPTLARFAGDLESLRVHGHKVERFNLSQSPQQFAAKPAILALLREKGADVLPAILVDGVLVHQGSYPDRAALAEMTGGSVNAGSSRSAIERTRAALESGRSVFICAADGKDEAFLEPFRTLAESPAFADTLELIELTGRDEAERALMVEVGMPENGEATAVLLVPPGYITAQWSGAANADDVLLRLLASASSCSPGGGCCA
jgi:hypothetical protein